MATPQPTAHNLTPRQRKALQGIGAEWAVAPRGTRSETLLSLKARGLIELKLIERIHPLARHLATYHSHYWQWRLTQPRPNT